jgi:hypothetical protein
MMMRKMTTTIEGIPEVVPRHHEGVLFHQATSAGHFVRCFARRIRRKGTLIFANLH